MQSGQPTATWMRCDTYYLDDVEHLTALPDASSHWPVRRPEKQRARLRGPFLEADEET
jgi:hypothetical protein